MSTWPRWTSDGHALREVAPGLFVGNAAALLARDESGAPRRWGGWVQCAHGTTDLGPVALRTVEAVGAAIDCTAILSLRDGAAVSPRDLDAALVVARSARELGDGPTLVSCSAGLSRSAVVAYALLRAEGIAAGDALRRVSVRGFDLASAAAAGLASVEAWIAARRDRSRGEREPVRL